MCVRCHKHGVRQTVLSMGRKTALYEGSLWLYMRVNVGTSGGSEFGCTLMSFSIYDASSLTEFVIGVTVCTSGDSEFGYMYVSSICDASSLTEFVIGIIVGSS